MDTTQFKSLADIPPMPFVKFSDGNYELNGQPVTKEQGESIEQVYKFSALLTVRRLELLIEEQRVNTNHIDYEDILSFINQMRKELL